MSPHLDPPLAGSVAALEGLDIPRGAYGGPRVARLSRALRVPVDALSLGELRFLLSEGRGVGHVLPIALVRLELNPWLMSEVGPGDLLLAVCVAADGLWATMPAWQAQLLDLLRAARGRLDTLDAALRDQLESELAVAEGRFGA